MPETPEYTAEDVAFYYRASLDSVTLVDALVSQDTRTEEEVDTLRRNDFGIPHSRVRSIYEQ